MKKVFLLVLLSLFLILGLCGGLYLRTNKVNVEGINEAEVCFIYGDAKTLSYLSVEELGLIKDIFNNKKLYKGNLSCGFNENISIKFNQSQTFCIARDTCPIIYWKEKNKYFKLTEEEKVLLYNILETYGFLFPCI